MTRGLPYDPGMTRLIALALIVLTSSLAGVIAVTSADSEPAPAAAPKCTGILAPGQSC